MKKPLFLLLGLMLANQSFATVFFYYYVHIPAGWTQTIRVNGSYDGYAVNLYPANAVNGVISYESTSYSRFKYTYSYWTYPYQMQVYWPTVQLAASPYTVYSSPYNYATYDKGGDVEYNGTISIPEYGTDIVRVHYYVGGAAPISQIVRYRILNETPDPVAIAVNVTWTDGTEEILTSHVEPQTTTEAQSSEIHSWIDQSTRTPVSATVRAYQNGEIVGESAPIDFTVETATGNYISEVHDVVIEYTPDPKLNMACNAMNGMEGTGSVVAQINTSAGFQSVTLGSVSAGSYYKPSVQLFRQSIDLAPGEVVYDVTYSILVDGTPVSSASANVAKSDTDFVYYASGTVNASGIPSVEPPSNEQDPASNEPPPGAVGSTGNPLDPPAPDGSNTNLAINYEKLTQAMEFALKNQGVSGLASNGFSIAAPGALEEATFTNWGVDASGSYDDGVGQSSTNLTTKGNGLVDFVDDWVGSFFQINLPENIGQNPVMSFSINNAAPFGAEFLPESIDVDLTQFSGLALVRMIELAVLHICGLFAAVKIIKAIFI